MDEWITHRLSGERARSGSPAKLGARSRRCAPVAFADASRATPS